MNTIANVVLLLAALVFCVVCYRTGWTAHYAGPDEVPPHLAGRYRRLRHFYFPSIALNIGTCLLLAGHVISRAIFDTGPEALQWVFGIGVGLAALAAILLAQTIRS